VSDFDPPEEPDMPTPLPPQEKRAGFLLLAFLIGFTIPWAVLPILNARAKQSVQAEAVKAGHAVYKVVDEFGHTQFEWLPVPGHPAPEKK
jgi:hypothetical protein